MKVGAKKIMPVPVGERRIGGSNPYASNFVKWGVTFPVRDSFPEQNLALENTLVFKFHLCKGAKFSPNNAADFHFDSLNPINISQDMIFTLVTCDGYFPNKTLHVPFNPISMSCISGRDPFFSKAQQPPNGPGPPHFEATPSHLVRHTTFSRTPLDE